MREEYVKLYKEHSAKYGANTCIFLEVGKFYEMYDKVQENGYGETSMQRAVAILGIQLSLRENQELFAGVPEQSLHKFAGILTREGWTVVVVDQEKNIQNKVISRNVSQILSPGTHIESFNQDSSFIGCLYFKEVINQAPYFSICVADISTGRCSSYESKLEGKYDSWNFDRLLHFFQVHPIRECLVLYDGTMIPTEEFLKQNLGIPTTLIHIKQYANLKKLFSENIINSFFKNKSILSIYEKLQVVQNSFTEISLSRLLEFLEDHFPSTKENCILEEHTMWKLETSVYLGNNVLNQLNFISQNNTSILNYFQKTFTPMGKRAMVERILYPICDIDTLSMRVYSLEKVINMDSSIRKKIEFCLKQICDLSRIHHKFYNYNLNSNDILLLDQSYTRILEIMKLYNTDKSFIESLEQYYTFFKTQFDIEKAKLNSEDTSFLNKDLAPKTFEIEESIKIVRTNAQSFLSKLKEFSKEQSLEYCEKETNLFSIDASRKVMTNIDTKLKNTKRELWPHSSIEITIRKANGSLASNYLEELHNQNLVLRSRLIQSVKKELPEICNSVSDNYKSLWLEIENYISEIDILFTMAKVCKEKNFVKPIYENNESGSGVSIIGLRHPLIEEQNTRIEYVKHNVNLDNNGWLLYGMNASGKSSLMKAVGIAVILAQIGCYVPAISLTLKPFKGIYTRILNQDNIYAGLSSFAVEMLELREILKKADQYSLILGDELCSGTESVSATSLVAAGIIYLHNKRSNFIFATHYHGLNDIPEVRDLENLKIYHLKVHYDIEKDLLVYDRNLEEGPGSTYYGLEVAKAMNIPYEFLELAQSIRKNILKQDSRSSPYNKNLEIKSCEVCGNNINSILEVHHIRQQKEANEDGFFTDGSHKDSVNNLIVLCSTCHDNYHAGKISIGKMKKTSDGEKREINKSDKSEEKKKNSKWKNEELEIIHSYLKEFNNMSVKRLAFELEQKENIKISEQSLRLMKKEQQ